MSIESAETQAKSYRYLRIAMIALLLLSLLAKPALHDGDIIFHQSHSACTKRSVR